MVITLVFGWLGYREFSIATCEAGVYYELHQTDRDRYVKMCVFWSIVAVWLRCSNSVAVWLWLVNFFHSWTERMEVPAFKFVSGSIVLVCLALVVLPTILQAIDPGNHLISEIKYTAQQNSSDGTLCSTANLSLVFKNVRSKIECILLCQGNSSCTSVNWKGARTCEMFLYNPETFETGTSCVYFTRGEKFTFGTFGQPVSVSTGTVTTTIPWIALCTKFNALTIKLT